MAAIEHFIQKKIEKTEIDEFLAKELKRAWYGKVEIQKTPLGTRIVVHAARPGIVIGRRGRNVKQLTRTMEEKFNLENPQIEVVEIEVPELNARVMAERLASRFERGTQYRRASYSILRRIKDAGAKGVEITVSGKLTSHRARYKKFRHGFVAKCGDPANLYVDGAVAYAIIKKGVIGINVKIMQDPDLLPNEIKLRKDVSEEKLNEIIGVEKTASDEIMDEIKESKEKKAKKKKSKKKEPKKEEEEELSEADEEKAEETETETEE
ncbi:MAG: 30S ribosomal protein S3 [Candidatus Lokiarchaeota archaeon]|nr:30S ribosomal protein S3 [Candidatus Lokiarchaeota archaeon]